MTTARIRIRRGTEAQVLAVTNGLDGEPYYSLDTERIFIADETGVPQPVSAAPPVRSTVTYTTASLATLADEVGSITLPAAICYLLQLTTDYPARVRLYLSSAMRDADRARLVTVDPEGNSGLVFEVVTTGGVLDLELTPIPVFASPTDSVMAYITVANLDTVSRVIQVDLEAIAPAAAGGGGGGSSSVIVFNPSVPSAGNSYQTSTEVADALNAVNGAATVFCDSSVDPCELLAGVTWDFKMIGTLQGGPMNSAYTQLRVYEGGIIKNCANFRSIDILSRGTATPFLEYDNYLYQVRIYLNNTSIGHSSVGSPGFDGWAVVLPENADVSLYLTNSSTSPVNTTHPLITLGDNAVLALFLSGSYLDDSLESVSGPATATVYQQYDASSYVLTAAQNPNFLGTLQLAPSDAGEKAPYTPTLVASLPAAPGDGAIRWASNGRKIGEGAGVGTGVLVAFSNGSWRRISDDAVVAS